MSEERLLDAYHAAAGEERRRPWGGMAPDEALMAAEEGAAEEWSFSAAVGCLLAFLFAEGAGDWWKVARRASALLRRYAPGRAGEMELPVEHAGFAGWGLEEFFRMVGEDGKAMMGKVLAWIWRENGKAALIEGTRRVYLVTRALDPQLLRLPGADGNDEPMGFEAMAAAFGEAGDGARARARWSARGKRMVVEEFARAGGAFARADFFGKGAAARESYRAAARGNRNRLGGRGR